MIVITYGEILAGVGMLMLLIVASWLANYQSRGNIIDGQVKADEPKRVEERVAEAVTWEQPSNASPSNASPSKYENQPTGQSAEQPSGKIDDVDMKALKVYAEKTLREQPWHSDDAVAAKTVLWEISKYEDDKRQAMINLPFDDYQKWKQEHPPQEALMYAKDALNYEKSVRNQPLARR